MTFEESYKYAIDIATTFINEEDGIASANNPPSDIFSPEYQLYNLLAFPYSNLFLPESRMQYENITQNRIYAQQLLRIRLKCLQVSSLTGINFVNELTSNIIDGILHIGGVSKSRAQRSELVTYFNQRPFMWFCVLASGIYNNRLIARSVKRRKPQRAAAQTIRKVV